MEKVNNSIRCDVCSCTHNCEGRNCCLDQIKVTDDCSGCTCCGNYQNKD